MQRIAPRLEPFRLAGLINRSVGDASHDLQGKVEHCEQIIIHLLDQINRQSIEKDELIAQLQGALIAEKRENAVDSIRALLNDLIRLSDSAQLWLPRSRTLPTDCLAQLQIR